MSYNDKRVLSYNWLRSERLQITSGDGLNKKISEESLM